MPVPESARGNPITTSAFEAPFETPIFPYGVGGVDLASPLDRIAVGRYSRLTNLAALPNQPGALAVRAGMTEVATATGNFHSQIRFDDPQANTTTYLWGVGGSVYLGQSGALTLIDTGYATDDPLSLLPYHPPLSGDPWIFIGNRDRMRKVRFDGLVLPIGNNAPTVAAVATLGTANSTNVASFTSADSTQWSNWTGVAGTDTSGNPTSPPTGSDDVDGSTFAAVPGSGILSSGRSYDSWWGLPRTLDLSLVGGVAAGDSDIFHLNLRLKNPSVIAEIRIYFVISAVFSTSTLPGTADSTTNNDFYMKAFRPGDFAVQVQAAASQIEAADDSKVIAEREASLAEQAKKRGFTAVTDFEVQRVDDTFMAPQDPAKKTSLQGGATTVQVTEFGTIGIPLSRGEFARYGNTPGRDWSTVTGMIVYIRSVVTTAKTILGINPATQIGFSLGGMTLFGGAGPDTIQPDTQSYDYRYTTYDPRTGDESNPSPVMADANFIDALRQEILVQPTAFGDAAMRQRFYRRGGTLTNDWYFAGVNASDGGVFTDGLSDLELAAADTLELDNYAPVPTVDDAGTTILSQPLQILIGPINGQLFGLGDPYRPGDIYASKPGHPDQWPPDLRQEVCAPSEELMNGVEYGGQIVVFSRSDCFIVYPNLIGASGTTALPAGCTRGLAGRWAMCKAFGLIYFVASDGIFSTTGAPEDDISMDLKPLFRGQTVNGYPPIDFTKDRNLRLFAFQNELYFVYEDTNADQRVWVFSPTGQQWRSYVYADNVVSGYGDEQANLLYWGLADRASTFTGTTDNGVAIDWAARTGSWDWGRPREEKLFGDQILDVDTGGDAITLQNFLNTESVTNPAQGAIAAAGRKRIIFDSFGTEPQKGRNLAVEIRGSSSGQAPVLYQLGTSLTPQPDITINRVTNWDDLGRADQSWVYGITLDANTSGEDRTLIFERDYLNQITPMASVTINHDGRHKLKYSWAGVPANQVRIRPDNTCGAWMCFRADWLSYPEPPRIAGWDSYFENGWDRYITGLDLYCDTEGQDKVVVVSVDGVIISDPATAQPFFTVNTSGKRVQHLTLPTFPPLRGHVLRLYATDANPGLLYDVRWHTVEEPSEQANWNQPFSIWGTQADKYLKALVFEIDTFGQDKTVAVEVDGVVLTTLTVNTNGRLVEQLSFPQVLGRVFRVIPTDANPSRLYSLRPVFDEEPFSLTRWETQETDHGLGGFHSLIEAMLTMKSDADVTLTILTHVNQTGTTVTDAYVIPSTLGIKQMCFVPFVARKGVLYKYVFTSADDFYLYREESHVLIQPFMGGEPLRRTPFGNSDVDPTRSMLNATLAAARSGGGSD